jgi:hypothetical protein
MLLKKSYAQILELVHGGPKKIKVIAAVNLCLFVGDEAHNKRVKDGLIIDQQTVYCVTSWAPVK